MTTSPRNDEIAAMRILVDLHGPDGPKEWEPWHYDTAEAAGAVVGRYLDRVEKRAAYQRARSERQVERGEANTRTREGNRRPRPRLQRSARTVSQVDRRAQVRMRRLAENPVCEGPERGLPGDCGIVSSERPLLEVNEIVPRSRAPLSDLVLELTSTLCQVHHDAVTSAHGAAYRTAELAGLLLPSEAVEYEWDAEIGKRLPRLKPGWSRTPAAVPEGTEA